VTVDPAPAGPAGAGPTGENSEGKSTARPQAAGAELPRRTGRGRSTREGQGSVERLVDRELGPIVDGIDYVVALLQDDPGLSVDDEAPRR